MRFRSSFDTFRHFQSGLATIGYADFGADLRHHFGGTRHGIRTVAMAGVNGRSRIARIGGSIADHVRALMMMFLNGKQQQLLERTMTDLRQRLQDAVDLKTEPRDLENLCAEVLPLVAKFEHLGPFDDETLQDLKRMIPFGLYDQGGVVTRNPLTQVYFRAGLLACREYMARFIEQGGDTTTAASIRANWWPHLGDDPGAPRLFDFAEVCEESDGSDGKPVFKSLDVSPSAEALPRAYQFLLPAVTAGDPTEPKQD